MNANSKAHTLPTATAMVLRQALSICGQATPVESRLARRAEMVHRLARMHRLDAPLLGPAPLFDGVRLIIRTRPAWALYNLSSDPIFEQGAFPLPARDLRRLQRMYMAGIQFDALAVAHELPETFRLGNDQLELSLFIPAPPPAATRLAAGLGRLANGILSSCLAMAGKPLAVMASAGEGIAAVLRDPVLLGAIIPPGVNPVEGTPAIWYLLAAWRW